MIICKPLELPGSQLIAHGLPSGGVCGTTRFPIILYAILEHSKVPDIRLYMLTQMGRLINLNYK